MNPQPIHAGGGFDRDRDREREMDEQRHRAIQQEDMARRERDRDRDEAERQHREQYQPTAPHHSSAGSLPIHQPVASRISATIHSPGGLLANHGGPAPSIPVGAPSGGPPPGYGGPVHAESGRPVQHSGPAPASASQHPMFAPLPHGPGGPGGPGSSIGGSGLPGAIFGGPLQQENGRGAPQEAGRGMQQVPIPSAMGPGQAMPSGPGGMSQGQQPILNVSGWLNREGLHHCMPAVKLT